MTGKPKLDESTLAYVWLFFQDSADNIRDLKRQHWAVTYYSLLVYAGLVGVKVLAVQSKHFTFWLMLVLAISAIGVGVMSIVLMCDCQQKLKENRVLLRKLWTNYFGEEAQEYFEPIPPNYTSFYYYWYILLLTVVVTFVGAGLAVLVISWEPIVSSVSVIPDVPTP